MSLKYLIRRLCGSPARWYGLENSSIIFEYVPLFSKTKRQHKLKRIDYSSLPSWTGDTSRIMREDGTQPRLGCDRKADVYGVALSHRQKLIRSVGLINHILDETDSLAGMNDVLPDFVHI